MSLKGTELSKLHFKVGWHIRGTSSSSSDFLRDLYAPKRIFPLKSGRVRPNIQRCASSPNYPVDQKQSISEDQRWVEDLKIMTCDRISAGIYLQVIGWHHHLVSLPVKVTFVGFLFHSLKYIWLGIKWKLGLKDSSNVQNHERIQCSVKITSLSGLLTMTPALFHQIKLCTYTDCTRLVVTCRWLQFVKRSRWRCDPWQSNNIWKSVKENSNKLSADQIWKLQAEWGWKETIDGLQIFMWMNSHVTRYIQRYTKSAFLGKWVD